MIKVSKPDADYFENLSQKLFSSVWAWTGTGSVDKGKLKFYYSIDCVILSEKGCGLKSGSVYLILNIVYLTAYTNALTMLTVLLIT